MVMRCATRLRAAVQALVFGAGRARARLARSVGRPVDHGVEPLRAVKPRLHRRRRGLPV